MDASEAKDSQTIPQTMRYKLWLYCGDLPLNLTLSTTTISLMMSRDPTYAAAPFDHAKADIILRSSDNIHFRVIKLFLSLASSSFDTLLDVSRPSGEDGCQEVKDGLLVVPVTEDSKTLDAFLRFCYPCTLADDPKLDVLEDAIGILEASRKYSAGAIEKKARQAIASPKNLELEPLRCYAVSRKARLYEEATLAAKYTLTQPLIPSWFQEIELLTATELLSLLTYHKKCGDAVYARRLDLTWITSHYANSEACSWLACTRCQRSNSPRYMLSPLFSFSLQWWEDFMEDVFLALRDKPCKKTVQAYAEKTVQAVKGRNCGTCSPRVTEGMRDFADLLIRKVDDIISRNWLYLSMPGGGKSKRGGKNVRGKKK